MSKTHIESNIWNETESINNYLYIICIFFPFKTIEIILSNILEHIRCIAIFWNFSFLIVSEISLNAPLHNEIKLSSIFPLWFSSTVFLTNLFVYFMPNLPVLMYFTKVNASTCKYMKVYSYTLHHVINRDF